MMVKICGFTNREDAVAAVDAGVSAVGFIFYPKSPRFIKRADAEAIANALPPEILRVGVFVDASPEETAEFPFLDILQLHGNEAAGLMASYSKPIWKAFRVKPGWSSDVVTDYATEAVMLDGPVPGSGHSFDWSIARGVQQKLILAGGLDADNVAEAIRLVQPWGVDACSRLESAPGRKDHEKMKQFIRAARSENL